MQSIEKGLGHAQYSLSYKDNRPTAILITREAELPAIQHQNQLLHVKKRKLEVRELKDIVTPLHHLSYAEQLASKVKPVVELGRELGCASEQIEVLESPTQTGYRNKCEFTFGFTDAGAPVLGFRPVKFTDSPNLVADPQGCSYHVSQEMLAAVAAVNSYLASRPGLVFDRLSLSGHLRVLMLRKLGSTTVGVLQVHLGSPEELAAHPELQAFISAVPVDSLYVECTQNIFEGFRAESALQQVKGDTAEYFEQLGGCTFKVPVLGFFQVNLKVAELLAGLIKRLVSSATVLDICCGSGVLGICAAKDTSRQVLGIEISPDAVKNAEDNSRANQIDGSYICNSVEKVLNTELSQVLARAGCQRATENEPSPSFSAILDPPRAGVSDKLMSRLAANPEISEIFYVSCNYRAVKLNLQTIISHGFTPKQIYVLDMFPFTKEVECVFHFKRTPPTE